MATTTLVIHALLWPSGAGIARFLLEPVPPDCIRVTLVEQFTKNPLLGLPNRANDVLLHAQPRVAAPAGRHRRRRPSAAGRRIA